MKKPSWNLLKRLILCMGAVLLTVGIATGLGAAAPAKAAEEIPISSVEDLMNMESNPSGSYYLTKDITLPKNMQSLFTEYARDKRFSGTLDGRGHKLKNYTFIQSSEPERFMGVGIFGYVENATFKNLSLTNVNININRGAHRAKVGPLVWGEAYGCKFDNIKVSGKITISSTGKDKDQTLSDLEVGGLINLTDGKLTNCSGSVKIKVDGGYLNSLSVGGLAGHVGGEKSTVKNCSFSGDISVSAKIAGVSNGAMGKTFNVAGICGNFSYARVSGCTNSGNVTFKMQKNGAIAPSSGGPGVYGIGGGVATYVSSCGNTGKISISAPHIEGTAEAAGLVGNIYTHSSKNVLTKCWNKGSVSAEGEGAYAGGLCIRAHFVNQCYNKGAVLASTRKVFDGGSEVGGICVRASRMQNCYNVGKVSLKGAGYAGGLASEINNDYSVSIGNYSTGAVLAKGGQYLERAALSPRIEYGKTILHPKCNIYDNYYTASTGCNTAYDFRIGDSTSAPRATKVSSITAGNCPKLSSTYWTYSSKYKRMILKNNKEK